MKFKIAHTSRGRVRIQVIQKFMTLEQADLLEAYLQTYPKVCQVSVHERTRCAIIRYHGSLDELLPFLRRFSYTAPEVLTLTPSHSSRTLNRMYEEKLVGKVVSKVLRTLFLPTPLARIYTLLRSSPRKASGRTVGWDLYRNFHGPKRLFHRRFRHVSTGIGGTSGGVDPQKVCG